MLINNILKYLHIYNYQQLTEKLCLFNNETIASVNR